MLLSLAGIPLTAGFVGKFYLLAAGKGSTLWLLVIPAVLGVYPAPLFNIMQQAIARLL